MGHVDHGKTTLLDYLRQSRITARESGGITQHIGAYQVEYQGKKLTFIDTPGHAAFNKMRERGAAVTDFVVLVVAANDGVKPQTIESIRHILAAKVPVVVAINKVDLPNVYPDVVKGELTQHGIMVQGFGGEVEVVEISALKGTGIDKLLETLVTMAELAELHADPKAPLEAVVIEAAKDARKGVTASVIVQQGTLAVRQDIYTDDASGRVKLLTNDLGQTLTQAGPGEPVEVTGFKDIPTVGSTVRDSAASYDQADTDAESPDVDQERLADDDFDFLKLLDDKPKLPLIVKADVEGTLEAILNTLDEESVQLLKADVGEVTEADLELATASKAAIIAFRTKVSKQILQFAKQQGIKIRSYDVIYQLIDDLQKQMLKLLEPTIDEITTGEAEILQIFEMKGERIAGIRVKTGELKKHDWFHLQRDGETVANPVIKTMMHGKQEVDKVTAKSECGLTFKNKKLDFRVGDILIAYKLDESLA